MRHAQWTILVIFAGCLAATAIGAIWPEYEQCLRGLLSQDPEIREASQAEIVGARQKLIGRLMDLVRDKDNLSDRSRHDSVIRAIQILGEFRAREATALLVERLGFPRIPLRHDELLTFHTPPFPGRYPAAWALVKMGDEESVPAIVRKVATTESVFEAEAGAMALFGLAGQDGAQAVLREAIGKAPDAKTKQRLEDCRQVVSRLKELEPTTAIAPGR